MIKFKFKELADRLGKPLVKIAEEAGLNRNTITALVQGDVNGVKFSTLDALCKAYGVAITDLLEFQSDTSRDERPNAINVERLYRQEGQVAMFTFWPPAIAWVDTRPVGSASSMGPIDVYFKDGYAYVYEDFLAMQKYAREFYRLFGGPQGSDEIYANYLQTTRPIERTYTHVDVRHLLAMGTEELKAYLRALLAMCKPFWDASIFIDSFDVGVDQEEIGRIAKLHDLTLEEVGVLTTPLEMTFNNERRLALLEIAESFVKSVSKAEDLEEAVKRLTHYNPDIQRYRKQFAYTKTTYAESVEMTDQEIMAELVQFLSDIPAMDEQLEELRTYEKKQQKKVADVLSAHGLKSNPLEFFSRLTYWREHRKKINLMSMYVMFRILDAVAARVGIPVKDLRFSTPDELDLVMKHFISRDVLEKRSREGVMVHMPTGVSFVMCEGAEAGSIREEHEKRLQAESGESLSLAGHTACQGYAKGTARIVLNTEDFEKFQEGDILVTGMTRPEYLPLMKKAAGIVTNEGGITCHAAIVSRELGKPCVISTKVATQRIKDGDIIEVRANHGTVRILSINE